MATLVRPITIALIVVMATVVALCGHALRYRRVVAVSALLGGYVLALAPWEIWMYRKAGAFIPVSSGGVPSVVDGLTWPANNPAVHNRNVPADVLEVINVVYSRRQEIRSFAQIREMGSQLLREQPTATIKLVLIKTGRCWYASDSGRFETPILYLQAGYLLLILVGSAKAIRRGGRLRLLNIFAWLLTFYFWTMSVLALSIFRYMAPAVSFLIAISGAALYTLAIERFQRWPRFQTF